MCIKNNVSRVGLLRGSDIWTGVTLKYLIICIFPLFGCKLTMKLYAQSIINWDVFEY